MKFSLSLLLLLFWRKMLSFKVVGRKTSVTNQVGRCAKITIHMSKINCKHALFLGLVERSSQRLVACRTRCPSPAMTRPIQCIHLQTQGRANTAVNAYGFKAQIGCMQTPKLDRDNRPAGVRQIHPKTYRLTRGDSQPLQWADVSQRIQIEAFSENCVSVDVDQ